MLISVWHIFTYLSLTLHVCLSLLSGCCLPWTLLKSELWSYLLKFCKLSHRCPNKPLFYFLHARASHRRVGGVLSSVVVSCTAGTLPESCMTAGLAPCRESRPRLPVGLVLSPTTSPNHCVMRRSSPTARSHLIPPSSLFSLSPIRPQPKNLEERER